MNNIITCVHCGKEFELSEVFIHQFEEEVNARAIKEAREKASKETELKLQESAEEKKELKEQNKLLQTQLQELNKLLKEMQVKNEQREAEQEKKLKDIEEKAKAEASKESNEKYRLDKLEYEKRLADMQKALEDAQRKGKQGSQQLQGEVLELDLEEKLKLQFPADEFLPIPKGVEGADIWQKVKDFKGNEAGSIVWETKRAKAWDKKWLGKLRSDMGKVDASECILVTQVLPNDVKEFHLVERVWVTDYEHALHVARVVRFLIAKVATAKASANHSEDDLIKIRDYITSDRFKHKINMHHDIINAMMEEHTSDMRLTQLRWKKREAQIKALDNNISQLDGEIQGIMPEVKSLSLPSDIDSSPEANAEDES